MFRVRGRVRAKVRRSLRGANVRVRRFWNVRVIGLLLGGTEGPLKRVL